MLELLWDLSHLPALSTHLIEQALNEHLLILSDSYIVKEQVKRQYVMKCVEDIKKVRNQLISFFFYNFHFFNCLKKKQIKCLTLKLLEIILCKYLMQLERFSFWAMLIILSGKADSFKEKNIHYGKMKHKTVIWNPFLENIGEMFVVTWSMTIIFWIEPFSLFHILFRMLSSSLFQCYFWPMHSFSFHEEKKKSLNQVLKIECNINIKKSKE